MKSNQGALIALFLIGIGGGLGLRLWASSQAVAIVGPNTLQVLDDGSIVATAGDHLYVHDRFGELVHRVPIQALGSEGYSGPIEAMDRDTVITRDDRRMDDSLERNLKAYALQPEPSIVGSAGPGVLQRCDLRGPSCQPLPSNDFHTRRVFGMAMSPSENRIVIADTMGWELISLDTDGGIQQVSYHEFLFPNEVDWVDGELWVADTNNLVLARALTEGDDFGRVVEEIDTDVDEYSWPIAFAAMKDERFAVVNANASLTETRVDVFGRDGTYHGRLDLPDGADILDAESFEERLYLADFAGFAIHEVLGPGSVQSFGSSEFISDMGDLKAARDRYLALKTAAMVLMVLTLVALLIVNQKSKSG